VIAIKETKKNATKHPISTNYYHPKSIKKLLKKTKIACDINRAHDWGDNYTSTAGIIFISPLSFARLDPENLFR
jgi:hypothetical protein